jgi:hypothetical protein
MAISHCNHSCKQAWGRYWVAVLLLVIIVIIPHCGLSAPPSPPVSSGSQARWWCCVGVVAVRGRQLDIAVVKAKNLKNENENVNY